VKIPHEAKLNGHSDADVALYALIDALPATRARAISARNSRPPIRNGRVRQRKRKVTSSMATGQQSAIVLL